MLSYWLEIKHEHVQSYRSARVCEYRLDLPHAAISELVVCSLPICIPPINAIQYHFLIVTIASVHTVRATFAQQRCLGTSHKYEEHLERYFGARVALP